MPGPSDAWLQGGTLPVPSLDLPPDTITPQGANFAAPPAVYQAPVTTPYQGQGDPFAGYSRPGDPYDPTRGQTTNPLESLDMVKMGAAAGPPPPPPPAPGGAAPPPPVAQADVPADVRFTPVSGGTALPAREAPTRGPKANAYLEQAQDVQQKAVDRNSLMSQLDAMHEADLYADEAQRQLAAKEASERVLQRRQAQLDDARRDYESTVNALAEKKIDNGRWWGNQSTPEKLGNLFLVLLGGFGSGQGGANGKNLVWEQVQNEIHDDVEAQKFDYKAGLDAAQGKETAYGLLMKQYGQEDLADAGARDAAFGAAQAKLAEQAAKNKGTAAGNYAADMGAKLEAERQHQRAAGLKYVPASATGPTYSVSVRGIQLPGTVDGKEANRIALEHGVKPAERVDEKMVEGGISIAGKRIENEGKRIENQSKREDREADRADKRAQFIAESEQRANLPQREAQVKAARERLNGAPITVGERAFDFAASRNGMPDFSYEKNPTAWKFVHGKEKAEREQAWQALKIEIRHDLAGANVTPLEASAIISALDGAGDQDSRELALKLADEKIAAAKKSIRAGTADSGAGYEENRKNVSPDSLGPSEFKRSVPSFKPVK